MVVTDVGEYTVIIGKEPDEDQDLMAVRAKWGKMNVSLCTSDLATFIDCASPVYTPDNVILYCSEKIPEVFKKGVQVCVIIHNEIILKYLKADKSNEESGNNGLY